MWLLPSLLVVIVISDRALATPAPGLLRVPKVYNAVITSNQNLAPSRAYPVIQPVVHRTAIGYVPPFYYTQLAPGFVGPEVVPLDPGYLGPRGVGGGGRREGGEEDDRRAGSSPAKPDDVESVETTDRTSGSNSPPPKKSSRPNSSAIRDVESAGELSSAESTEEASSSPDSDKSKKGKNDRVPLSFYPNYQSLYYDPYFYPYNAFPPHLAAPGTYYVDYPQPPAILGPLGPPPPPPLVPGVYPVPGRQPEAAPEDSDQNSARRNEKEKLKVTESREKIPDVPPPPLPTTIRKKAS